MASAIRAHAGDLDGAAAVIVQEALQQGSPDNLTLQIVRIDGLPDPGAVEIAGQVSGLALTPLPHARALFDGYRIIRELPGSSRSHIYLAPAPETLALVRPKNIRTNTVRE